MSENGEEIEIQSQESQESESEVSERRRHVTDETEQNAEEGDVPEEEVDLDESEVIQDYVLQSLSLCDDAFEWIYKSSKKYCIVAILGKSRFGKTLNQVIFPLLRPKRDFRKIAQFDECGIEFYWCPEEQVIFLVPKASNDFSALIELAKSIQACDGEFSGQSRLKENDAKNALVHLFMLSVCHLALLIQPTTSLDIELDSWFHSVDDCRKNLLNPLSRLLGSLGVESDWRRFARPCPPRLLLFFEKCALSQEDLRDFADGDFARTKRKRVPQKRLIDSLENQIYNIFRHSRLLTDSATNNLFTVPEKDNYVLVLQPQDARIMEENMPIPSCLELLQDSIKIQRESDLSIAERTSKWGKRRRSADLWSSIDQGKSKNAAPNDELWNFLIPHIEPIVMGKGHNDNMRRSTRIHFDIAPLSLFLQTCDALYRYIILDTVPEQIPEAERETMLSKLAEQKAKLQKALNPELTFSDARCSKLLPEAHKAYLTSLPSHYTTRIHNNQVQQALIVYRQHARGPAADKYEKELKQKCVAEWRNGRQLCEVHSLTNRHCVHKWHRLPGQGGEGVVMSHNSRSRTLASSGCGRLQAQRDDPFSLEEANHSFYADLEEKLYPKLDRIPFEVFNPDLATIQDKVSQLQLDSNSDSGLTQPRSQSDIKTEDDAEQIEDVQQVMPSRARYLSGMETTDSPKGLLPLFPSWSCMKYGAFSSYSEMKGIEQPGFINRSNFLLRWDISPVVRGFIGYEYETARGNRFFMQTPTKVVQGGSSGVAPSATVVLDHEYMPLYVPSPSSRGHRSTGSAGQLMRIWFAIPSHCESEVKIRPLVTPGRNAPTFRTSPEEITLTTNAVWILRFPFVYRDEAETYFAPKESADFINFKVSKILSPKVAKKG